MPWITVKALMVRQSPVYRPGNEHATRAEIRCPDPACNPYLAFSVMLAASLEGITKKYRIPKPIEPNIYNMEAKDRKDMGMEQLPVNLFEALKETEKSELVKKALG